MTNTNNTTLVNPLDQFTINQTFGLLAFLKAVKDKDNQYFYEAHLKLNADNKDFDSTIEQKAPENVTSFKDEWDINTFLKWYLPHYQQDSKLIEGINNNNLTPKLIEDLFDQLDGYADYVQEVVDFYNSEEYQEQLKHNDKGLF